MRNQLVRTGSATAGLAVALTLVLAGCGGGGDSGDKDKGGSAPSATASGDAGSGSDSDTASVDGTWAAVTDGKPVAMSVTSGKVTLAAESHLCEGEVADMGGEPMFSLTCADGNKDRAMGTIESNDGKTLVVSWDGGKKDSFTNGGAGGLPTALPSDFPTDLPTTLPTDLPTDLPTSR
ncbi:MULTISPECIES: hypothetical protein [unclassified Streptomyces]|uniref:hypothetical protein n=1 Tax=unclassified Streptomyces TaxID=2593676 RepID=UPI002E29A617|nr:hypothetical protein [Streptomyces sp. NBC_01429]